MVIITDAYGNIQSPTIPENVYQGSNLANEIVFLSPLPQNNQCAIIFRLPTGAVTSQYFMTPYTSVPSQYGLNGWVFRVPRAITTYYGQVTFQIKMFGSTYQQGDNETATTEVIMSCQGSFPVLRGVAPLPETPSQSTFDDILAYLQALTDGSIVSKGLLPYDSTFTYGIGVSVYDDDTKTIYTSLQDDNVGNDLDDTEYWSAYYVSNVTIEDVEDKIDEIAEPKITNDNKLSADLVDDLNSLHKFVSSTDIANWNGKQNALSETQLDAVNSGIDSTKVGQIATNTSDIATIEGKIPSQASSSNQLADKNFVNSSIATNTANFIGTFANITALNSYAGTITNNDYAIVRNQELNFNNTTEMNAYDKDLLTNYDYAWIPNGTKYDLYRFDITTQTWGSRATNVAKTDVSLIQAYNRYKYNGGTEEWNWEYTINTSGFTAVQWQAINSGITDDLVAQITTNENAISGIKNGTTINNFAGVESALSDKANKSTIATYTLSSANWSNNQYTLNVTGKTANNKAQVNIWAGDSESTASSVLANQQVLFDANIYMIVDNGTSLTLTCETTPTSDLKIDVEVFE